MIQQNVEFSIFFGNEATSLKEFQDTPWILTGQKARYYITIALIAKDYQHAWSFVSYVNNHRVSGMLNAILEAEKSFKEKILIIKPTIIYTIDNGQIKTEVLTETKADKKIFKLQADDHQYLILGKPDQLLKEIKKHKPKAKLIPPTIKVCGCKLIAMNNV